MLLAINPWIILSPQFLDACDEVRIDSIIIEPKIADIGTIHLLLEKRDRINTTKKPIGSVTFASKTAINAIIAPLS